MKDTVYIWEKKVGGSVPAAVSSLFATLIGELEQMEQCFVPRERDDSRETLKRIEVLEGVAVSLAVAAIREITAAAGQRIIREQKREDFNTSDSALVFSHYPRGGFAGYVWIRRETDGAQLSIRISRIGEGRGFVEEEVVVATLESFDSAYAWVAANEELLTEKIVELIATFSAGLNREEVE